MLQFLYGLAALGALLGAAALMVGVAMADTPMHEAGAAAVAASLAVVPYCLARAVDGWHTARYESKARQP